jgi:bifunctional UDP-N-acetylglucosamine pyrophosphorylase/glucosamine-1-phosphate N-acetyltransferase
MGAGSKASHLAYLGDATIGCDVNVGAGSVTCNYDGVDKHQTVIGDGAFVGTNSTLVAPLNIGAKSFVAAGSTVTSNVEEQSLAVGRGKQRNIAKWLSPLKRKQKTSPDR